MLIIYILPYIYTLSLPPLNYTTQHYTQVLLGQQYTQKSNIHSLALAIWEIVSAGKVTKFSTNTNREDSVVQNNAGELWLLC